MGIIVVLLICVIIFITILLSIKRKDNFMEPQLNIITSIDNNKLYLLYDKFNITHTNLRNIELTDTFRENNNTLIISDVYNYTIKQKNDSVLKLFTILPDEKVLMFLQNKANTSKYSGTDLKELKNGTIGYLNETDDNLIKIICLSLDLDKDSIKTKLIKIEEINSVDCLFIFSSLNNEFLYKMLDTEKNKYKFFDYNIDINKIKFYLPYIKKKNHVISDFIKERKDLTVVKTLYSIDTVLYGTSLVESNVYLTLQLNSINANQGNFDTINYYTMYFDFFKQTMEYLELENTHTSNKSSLPILEQFLEENIPGFYDDNKKRIYPLTLVTPDNLPLIPDNYIKLENQDREEENGVYKITDESLNKVNIKEPSDSMDKYICFNDPLIKDESQCAPLNWDRPCETNEECPFYQKNKNYRNYRGGCDTNKHCEMPLGIKSVAFRNYDQNSKVMCYGCDDLSANCCDTQANPDYAFALDQFDRK
jgi:hypothetical protein